MQLDQDIQAARASVSGIVSEIQAILRSSVLNADDCAALLELCNAYFKEIAEIRSSGRADAGWMEMRKSALRNEGRMHSLIRKINQLTEHQAINAGYGDQNVIGIALGLLVLLFLRSSYSFDRNAASSTWLLSALACGILFLAWRFFPVLRWKRQLRDMADRF